MNEGSAVPERIFHASRSIQEFRIDFLLEEEFCCNPEFTRSFVSACGLSSEAISVDEVVLEPKLGRSGFGDLAVCLRTRDQSGSTIRILLLIEDKIGAGAQPNQAERYLRWAEEQRGKGCDDYRTVLIAPSGYIGERSDFQVFIPLETISDWICDPEPLRVAFRRRKIAEAIVKKNATGVQIVDPVMTSFRTAYYGYLKEFNARRGTDFRMQPPKPTYDGDTWISLMSNSFLPECEIRHKIRTSMKAATGLVEIAFKNTDIDKCAALKGLIDPDMRLIANGKRRQHVAIEVTVPEIKETAGFDTETPKVETALSAAERLWRQYCAQRGDFERIIHLARGK